MLSVALPRHLQALRYQLHTRTLSAGARLFLELATNPRRKPDAGSGTLRSGPLCLLPGTHRAPAARTCCPRQRHLLLAALSGLPVAVRRNAGATLCERSGRALPAAFLQRPAEAPPPAPPPPVPPNPPPQMCLSTLGSVPRWRAWAPG